jgi:glutamyl-tRNA synthetase
MTRKVRTRFAPSPTGPLHLGGIRTALYAYLFAKKNQGDFILRIEDTDQNRSVLGAEEYIIETLRWAGIIPDEGVGFGGDFGPYRQSDRKDIYANYAQRLIENGSAYYAFDTDEEIAAWRESSAKLNHGISDAYNFMTRGSMRNALTMPSDEVARLINQKVPYVIRLKVDDGEDLVFNDMIRGDVAFQKSQLDDRILIKSDGMPTYHLANVVDDYLMQVTDVIRGEEWLASTPHHILLYKAFGWESLMPSFSHLPLILKPDGKGKLSKRDGDRLGFPVFGLAWTDPESGETSLGYRERGFEPHAFINFLAMLGWNDGTEKEVFTMEELIQGFSLERVHKAGAKFNYEKAVWFNQHFVMNMSDEELIDYLRAELTSFELTDVFLNQYIKLFKNRVQFKRELLEVGSYLYDSMRYIDKDTFAKKWVAQTQVVVDDLISYLEAVDALSATDIEHFLTDYIKSKELNMGQIMPIFRIALTGIMKGPSVFETIEILGKEKSVERLKRVPDAYI